MSDLVWTNVTVKLGDLKPWSDNPRMSSKAQAKRLLASFDKFGQVQTVAVSPTLDVYDGHQRLSALLTIHGADYAIDARQSSRPLSEQERKELVISLHAGAVGGWDWDKVSGWDAGDLQGWGLDGDLLKSWNNDANNLKELLKSETATTDAEVDTDRAAELLAKWGVVTGDLWQIGDHRLICGDCTDAAVVARVMDIPLRLMVTDPPYGVEYEADWRNEAFGEGNRATGEVENDDVIDWRLAWQLFCGDVVYCWHADQHASKVEASLVDCGFITRAQIIWSKPHYVVSRGHYSARHEPCWYAVRKGKTSHWIGADNEQTVWNIDLDERAAGGHSTQKPIECMARPIRNHEGDVYEPFSGSGTTLVACQNLTRRCRAVEISPAYVAVALERMSAAFPALEIKRL
jgi:DNA modification methylase